MRDAQRILHQLERQGNLLSAFISHQDNRSEMLQFIMSPSADQYRELNHRFQQFCFECRFIHYMSKFIYYQSINYIRKVRKIQSRALSDRYNEKYMTEDEPSKKFIQTEFECPILDQAIMKLTVHQRKVIHLHYQKDWKLREIADSLNVSPQSISKTHRRALDHLKKWMEGEKYA
ncbi:sigma-70 family RNA polymerase sigma factor [Pseudalkalibacillus salsuginis]|uniref:sigma-70 family RNA polymerase sigma factor n=1 Tax=Pseudalkalibacillus salsuginis TaxID=2910972 RepID=UPI001F2B0CBA|nr:sigma-70 family RNA polymerase sigma factor [Pseudalkalibacillus salsuginis]MCF6410858.1 sigma-70 family RNA polymerase sigma factor [Pseudalkalibacillus salsuginis]